MDDAYEEDELRKISKNWYSKIKENKKVEGDMYKHFEENAIQRALDKIFTRIRIAYGKNTENYAIIGDINPKTKDFENSAFIEAIQKVKDVTNFRFYMYKAHKFAIDFWNYQNIYGVVAVAQEEDLEAFREDRKPFKITILKEL